MNNLSFDVVIEPLPLLDFLATTLIAFCISCGSKLKCVEFKDALKLHEDQPPFPPTACLNKLFVVCQVIPAFVPPPLYDVCNVS